ncbi:16S rRNA processing protein rimM [Spiroplasma corruscae]|uniref:16S rRNA processing protein rimM n=1 Tax=Spiroplasma corruscae TaxID=216934 RepID=A0A222EQI6_9MOLU|nr:hypothetical protein [Spiroplasma corruscae]ASP28523.1 16S rRNA processing protein rimM [Spiroplasma corruscae]
MENKLIKVGEIVSTHGIKGSIKFSLSDKYDYDKSLINETFFIKDRVSFLPYKIENVYFKNTNCIIKFTSINSINEACNLVKKEVFINKDKKLFINTINYNDYSVKFNDINYSVLDVIDNGVYWLVKINYIDTIVWIPLVDKYVEFINDDEQLIKAINIDSLRV